VAFACSAGTCIDPQQGLDLVSSNDEALKELKTSYASGLRRIVRVSTEISLRIGPLSFGSRDALFAAWSSDNTKNTSSRPSTATRSPTLSRLVSGMMSASIPRRLG